MRPTLEKLNGFLENLADKMAQSGPRPLTPAEIERARMFARYPSFRRTLVKLFGPVVIRPPATCTRPRRHFPAPAPQPPRNMVAVDFSREAAKPRRTAPKSKIA